MDSSRESEFDARLTRLEAAVAAIEQSVEALRRVQAQTLPVGDTDLGPRDPLLGAALAVWYVSAYAAAVWYDLIPIPAARFILFALTIVSMWIALDESKEIFGLVAVGVGFFTP